MRVLSSASVWLNAIKNHSRESLQLLCMQRGQRDLQVLQSARMPNAKRNHLFFKQGMQTATSMAPLTKPMWGWLHLSQIFPANYGFHLSHSYAIFLRKPTMQECQKLQGESPCGVSQNARTGFKGETLMPLSQFFSMKNA